MNFNPSERDKRMLMIIGGIVIFLLLYFVVYKPFVAKTEALDAENAALAAHLAILQDYYANLETYELGINASRREVRAQTAHYPNDIRSEDKVMYAVGMEDKVGLTISTTAFGAPVMVMEIPGVQQDKDTGVITAVPVAAYGSALTLSCTMGYQQLKDMVNYVYDTWNVTGVESLNVSYDSSTGDLVGNMVLNQFFLTGLDTKYYPTQIPEVTIGKSNLFGTIQ